MRSPIGTPHNWGVGDVLAEEGGKVRAHNTQVCLVSGLRAVGACEGVEDVQGVLTLSCSGAAQVCHALRVDELREQLEVEEEDGDRQEEEVEVESGEASQGERTMNMVMVDYERR